MLGVGQWNKIGVISGWLRFFVRCQHPICAPRSTLPASTRTMVLWQSSQRRLPLPTGRPPPTPTQLGLASHSKLFLTTTPPPARVWPNPVTTSLSSASHLRAPRSATATLWKPFLPPCQRRHHLSTTCHHQAPGFHCHLYIYMFFNLLFIIIVDLAFCQFPPYGKVTQSRTLMFCFSRYPPSRSITFHHK